MDFYTFYTPSHEEIYNNFFLESFPDKEMNLHVSQFDQSCKTANYRDSGWKETMLHKLDTVIEGLEANLGEYIVHGDCDIQFFSQNLKPELIKEIGDYDIAFQDDGTRYCAGFFICKSSKLLIDLFNDIKNNLDKFPDDQEALQYFLRYNYNSIKPKKLSKRFYTYASEINWKAYDKSDDITPSRKDILVHHANYTVGVENKIYILEKVKKHMNKLSK